MFMKSIEVCFLENIPKHEFRNVLTKHVFIDETLQAMIYEQA